MLKVLLSFIVFSAPAYAGDWSESECQTFFDMASVWKENTDGGRFGAEISAILLLDNLELSEKGQQIPDEIMTDILSITGRRSEQVRAINQHVGLFLIFIMEKSGCGNPYVIRN